MSTISFDSAPVLDAATEPAAIRNGNAQAKQAYQEGLAFEQMLVDQLTQEMAATTATTDDGSDDGSSDDSGVLGTDSADSPLTSMLPQALSSSVMSAGGLGIAAQVAASIDPALEGKL